MFKMPKAFQTSQQEDYMNAKEEIKKHIKEEVSKLKIVFPKREEWETSDDYECNCLDVLHDIRDSYNFAELSISKYGNEDLADFIYEEMWEELIKRLPVMNTSKIDIIVIGGDSDDKVVKWAEQNGTHGLYTGFLVTEIVEDGFKIVGYDDVVTNDNVYAHLFSEEEFFEWVKHELEYYKTEEEMDIFKNDFTDFLMK